MFKKLVSNLPFSPALVGQLGFYAKRLRKEEATRRIGLIFTALALVVQFFAVFQPPQAANASSSNDFIPGGFNTVKDYLSAYDRNAYNLKDIFSSLGITRSEIAATKFVTLSTRTNMYTWGHHHVFSAAQGEKSYQFKKAAGGTGTVYYRPARLWEASNHNKPFNYTAYQGYSKKAGWFALLRVCGNLATKTPPTPPPAPPKPSPKPAAACTSLKISVVSRTLVQMTGQATTSGGASVKSYNFTVKDSSGKTVYNKQISSSKLAASTDAFTLSTPGSYKGTLTVNTSAGAKTSSACAGQFTIAKPAMCSLNPTLPANSPDCQPCPGTPNIWIKSKECKANVVETKTAKNITQGGVDATTVVAKASDKISYEITVKNVGKKTTNATLKDDLSDVLEYSTLIDNGGGTFDKDSQIISWPEVTLKPGEQQTRSFSVQLLQKIPSTNTGKSNPESYNCVMTNSFGNTVSINVNCPQVKEVENVVEQLPHTGPGENMLFAGVVLAVVVYFYTRSRQMNKEVRLIRRDLNSGAI